MYLELVILLCGVLLAFYLTALRKTVFGISLKDGNLFGLFHLIQLSVYTLPAILALNYYPIETFWVAFKVQQHTVGWISLILLGSYFLYLFALKFISSTSRRYFTFERPHLTGRQPEIYRRFVWASVLILLVLVTLASVVLGAENSFAKTLIDGENLSAQRFSQGGGALTSLVKFTCILMPKFLIAVIASGAFAGRGGQKLFLVAALLYFSGWSGNKAPIIELFIIYFLVSSTVSGRSFSLADVLKLFALIALLLCLIFFLVSVQYKDLDNSELFFNYFLQRTFVAQTIGFYEQFNLHLQSHAYALHGVPFASFFSDFPVFHKDLMLYSEDRFDLSAIGIKNTFFVAEAYGMGGAWFIIPSIFIYAVNYTLTFVIIVVFLNQMLVKNTSMNKIIAAGGYFSFVNVTGGFSDLMLFKILIMIMIILIPFVAASFLSRLKISKA